MHRNSDRAGLVRNGAGDGLTDPPGCVGAEFEAFFIIEFFDRLDQPEITLLDQIQQTHPAADVTFGDTDDESQVGLRELLFRFDVSRFHTHRQVQFFFRSKQRDLADLLQIESDRVVDIDGFRRGFEIRILDFYFKLRIVRFGNVHVDVVEAALCIPGFFHVDAALLKKHVNRVEIVRVKIRSFEYLRKIFVAQLAGLLADLEQLLNLRKTLVVLDFLRIESDFSGDHFFFCHVASF